MRIMYIGKAKPSPPFPGYLMVRKHGVWGKLCLDNFEQVTSRASATWTVSDLGQAVCKTLTFRYVNPFMFYINHLMYSLECLGLPCIRIFMLSSMTK